MKDEKFITRLGSFIAMMTIMVATMGMQAEAVAPPTSFAPIIGPHLPAVVNISTTMELKGGGKEGIMNNIPEWHPFYEMLRPFSEELMNRRPQKTSSLGSGVIIDPKGIIVTNNHLIADATEVIVTLSDKDKTEYKAEVVGKDPRTDIAVLKIKSDKPLPHVEWADSDQVHVGDWLIAVGNPHGLSNSVTLGIVSAVARDISDRQARSNNISDIVDGYFQTDAAINLGNSGGAAFDVNGKVIGINTAILSSVENAGNIGIAFAIPSNTVKSVVEQLLKYGKTRRGWIGVQIQPLNKAMAEVFGLKKAEGALVASVTPEGPAARAKIKNGDIILKVNGVTVKDSRNLPRIVGKISVGSKVPVVIWRDQKEHKVEIEIQEFEKAAEKGLLGPAYTVEPEKGAKEEQDVFGMRFEELKGKKTKEKGIKIKAVYPGGQAARKGLAAGDILLMVASTEITSVPQFKKLIADFQKQGAKEVPILVSRNGQQLYVTFKLQEDAPASTTPIQ